VGGSGLYEPKGYIVEYGMPGDTSLNIVASTSIYLPQVVNTTSETLCESGFATISAEPSEGTILWYDVPTGGIPKGSGNTFRTSFITENTNLVRVLFFGMMFQQEVSQKGLETLLEHHLLQKTQCIMLQYL